MVNLQKVVDSIRDDLKALYLQDRNKVWAHPFVALIKRNDVESLSGASSEEAIVEWLRFNRGPGQIDGVVVGRMVAKYSQTIRDVDGNPEIVEKAILVSGRILSTNQTYISITPCKEHKDLRNPLGDSVANAEPKPGLLHNPGLNSPDKVQKMVDDEGHFQGFVSMQFGVEQVFDSRKGDVCVLDPIIQGVLETGTAGHA